MTGLFSLLRIRSLWILVMLFVVGEVPFSTKKTLPVNAQSIQISIPNPSETKNSESKPTASPSPDSKPASTIDTPEPVTPNAPTRKVPTTSQPPSKPNAPPISSDLNPIEISRSITVKITAPDFIGSGTIVGFNKGTYTVITNAHVIIGGKPPYRITTSDRVVHQAKLVSTPEFKRYDLAVIQFRAPARKYAVAKLGNSASLKVGDRLFVGGFTKQAKQRDRDDFLVQTGAVSLVLKSRMNDSGYKIGYTHRIYRGMSGGSVIDIAGRLVGINGLLGDPVWKVQTKFADGSSACEPLQNLIDRSGFAIAIDDITSLTTRAKWWHKRISSEPTNVEKQIPVTQPDTIELQQAATKALSCN
jgi:S1-C subfamily serine protease